MKWKPESAHQSCLYIPVNLICATRVDCEIMWLHIKVWLNSVCILMQEQCTLRAVRWGEREQESEKRRERARKQPEKISLQRKNKYIGKNWIVLTFSEYFIQEKRRLNTIFRCIKAHLKYYLSCIYCIFKTCILPSPSTWEEMQLVWCQKQQSQCVSSLSIIYAASFPWSLPVYWWCSKSWLWHQSYEISDCLTADRRAALTGDEKRSLRKALQ